MYKSTTRLLHTQWIPRCMLITGLDVASPHSPYSGLLGPRNLTEFSRRSTKRRRNCSCPSSHCRGSLFPHFYPSRLPWQSWRIDLRSYHRINHRSHLKRHPCCWYSTGHCCQVQSQEHLVGKIGGQLWKCSLDGACLWLECGGWSMIKLFLVL